MPVMGLYSRMPLSHVIGSSAALNSEMTLALKSETGIFEAVEVMPFVLVSRPFIFSIAVGRLSRSSSMVKSSEVTSFWSRMWMNMEVTLWCVKPMYRAVLVARSSKLALTP